MNIEQARFNMIEQQIRPWDVLDSRVLDSLRRVRRECFVPDGYQAQAFTDVMLPLDHGQAMMSPVVEGRVLQALNVQEGERVLEIGTGSGFLAACLSQMGGVVTSVEIFPDLSEKARHVLDAQGYTSVELETGDASQGWNNHHLYSVIAITGAVSTIADAYKYQLSVGGRLFAVVGQEPAMQAVLVTRDTENEWRFQSLFETSLPYLINSVPTPRFIL
ncbi:MAG TPA: protein-L-isoaspartate O-methyltransferase [bacterium]|nr:protein-L-isoaspartate O-methyltransferase [bacterium]